MQAHRYLILGLFLLGSLQVLGESKKVSIDFYSETFVFHHETPFDSPIQIRFYDRFFKVCYREMESTSYRPFVDQMLQIKSTYNLNGWLYFKLMNETIQKLYPNYSDNIHTLYTWFYLSKSGFDVRLTHKHRRLYIQGFTMDELYEIPYFQLGKRKFVNLTAIITKRFPRSMEFYLVEFIPNERGKPMTFDLANFPTLSPQIISRQINFKWRNKDLQLNLKLDKTIIDLMKTYPMFDERYYLETPLSKTLYNSLIPQLKNIIKGKTTKETIQILLAFTRSAFPYKEDSDYFGKNKPMISDEVIFYAYSDCEDRSALFYNLVKDLVQLPMIIVAYSDHLTIGVQLAETIGKPLYFGSRRYTICDPTGPTNSDRVGVYPKGYDRKKYEVIGNYR